MKILNTFINWFSPSLEDANGSASYRRLSALVFIGLIIYMIVADTIKDQIHLYAFYALLTTFLLLVAVVTIDSVSMAWARIRYGDNGKDAVPDKPDPQVEVTTKITPQA